MRLPSSFPIAPGSKCLFIGDSITESGRDACGEATPWAPGLGQGNGYVGYANALMNALDPKRRIRVVNRGIGGHTVHDLKDRWKSDVLDLAPDWLVVMIGINDVWRQFDTPLRTEMHHTLSDFETVYRELLQQSRPQLDGLVLISPYVIETNLDDSMRRQMDAHGAIVKELAGDFDALFVDAQAAMDRMTSHWHPTSLAWDRIHPNPTGHMALALAFLEVLGLQLGD